MSRWVPLAAGAALWLCACSGGRDKWIADLQSNRPEQRALAVKKLAERYSDDDLVLFTQAARDPSALVRAEAISAIARSSDSQVLDHLGEALADPDESVMQRAATALAGIKSEKARSYLTLQYSRRGRGTRLAIVQALKSANVPGAMAAVVAAESNATWERNLKALKDGALPERVGAAEELGRSGRPEAVNRLVPLLKDNQVVLAAAAARGLGYAGDRRAAEPLMALLDEKYPELREAACEALGRLKETAATPRLLAAALEHGPSGPIATATLIALPRSDDTDRALCELLVSGPSAEAAAAGRELHRRAGCPAEPLFEKLKNPATAPNALFAIAALGPLVKDASAKITPLLAASDATTRKLAVDALVELGDASTAPAVARAFDAEVKALEPLRLDWVASPLPRTFGRGFDPSQPLPEDDPAFLTRMRVSDLLRKVGQLDQKRAAEQGKVMLEAVPPRDVIDDATEEQVRVLAALVRAAGRLRMDGARERVEPMLGESSPSLRGAGYAALAWLGGDALALARRGLFDSERQVQAATAQALAESGPAGQGILIEALAQLAGDRSRLLEAVKGVQLPKASVPVLLAIVREGGVESGAAATLIGETQEPAAVKPLLDALVDPVCVAEKELIAALGRLKDPSAAEVVGRFLYSDSAEVRAVAAEALAQLGPGAAAEALDALKGDYTLRVRDAASAALQAAAPEGKR